VIVHAYEEWGDACVGHLRGIFAFGIWDANQRRLLLARDRLGVKPLYYWSYGSGFVFASQPRAILAHPDFRPQVDLWALQHYLAYRYVPHDLAIYAGMAKLPAAHTLVADDGGVSLNRYWELGYEPRIRTIGEARELIRHRIENAVRSQLVSDVPIGLFLSGGIDSSTVGTLAAAAMRETLASFTIGFGEAEYDERQHARRSAEHMGSRRHEEMLSLDRALALLPDFVDTYDEPFFDHSGLPTLAVSRLAQRSDRKVVLAGDGADEIFAGYRWYEGIPDSSSASLAQLLLRRDTPDPLEVHFERIGLIDGERQAALLADAPAFDSLEHWRRLLRDDVPALTALQLLDLQTFLVDDVLLKVDHASMACGVEVRVPFLDHELVETAFRIDANIIFEGGERKALLKRAARVWLPRDILTARKKGFGAPIGPWMRSGLRELASRLLPDGSLVGRGIFRGDVTRAFVSDARPKEVWLLLAAELWARRWLEGETLDLASAIDRPPSS
jgi:asparagine synthase (glutamine-hydrolysing)